MTTTHYQIVNGPSKMDLMLGLFDNTFDKPRLVSFTVHDGQDPDSTVKIDVCLNSVGRESGDGEQWLISGYVANSHGETFEGYYTTRQRRGNIDIDEYNRVIAEDIVNGPTDREMHSVG